MIFKNPFKNKYYIFNVIVILIIATAIVAIAMPLTPRQSTIMLFPSLIVIYALGLEMFIANRTVRIIFTIILLAVLFTYIYILGYYS